MAAQLHSIMNLNTCFFFIFPFEDPEQLHGFASSHSIRSGYAIGKTAAASKHCEYKMVHDVIVLEGKMDGITLAKSNRQKASSSLDKLGLIGLLFLSINYFFVLNLVLVRRNTVIV